MSYFKVSVNNILNMSTKEKKKNIEMLLVKSTFSQDKSNTPAHYKV